MKRLSTLSAFLQNRLVVLLPVSMLAGFAYGITGTTEMLKDAVLPITFFLVFPMMVGIDIRKLFDKGDLRLQVITLLINFIIVPLSAFGLGLLAFPHAPWLRLGLLLASLLPTSGMTVSWTGMSKGNVPEAVKMTVIGLLGGALSVPVYISLLMGEAVSMPLSMVATQIAVIVLLPLLLGTATRSVLVRSIGEKRFGNEIKPLLPGLSTLGVLTLVFVAIALKAPAILADPGLLWNTFWPSLVLYAFNFTGSSLVGRWLFPVAEAKALVFGTVLRNLSIALALLMGLAGQKGGEAALIVTWGFVIQVQGAAWYVRYADRILSRKK